MRRWFELGTLTDTTYAASGGDREFHQFPQKDEYIAWLNQMVGIICRLTKGGDSTLCDGVGSPHVIQNVAPCTTISAGGELRSLALFQGIPPVNQGLIRQYFDPPGIYDGPNESQTVEKPRGSAAKGGGSSGGTFKISLANYLNLLIQTWAGGMRLKSGQFLVAPAPQIWQEWLIRLLFLYDAGRLTTTQVYAFLGQVDWTKSPPRLPR